MNETKYIGLDVHQATISVAVLDFFGKLLMEAILETKAAVLQSIHGLRGSLHATLEEGTCAAWLQKLHQGKYRCVAGQLKRSKKVLAIRGLNIKHNHDLKNIFKDAATRTGRTDNP